MNGLSTRYYKQTRKTKRAFWWGIVLLALVYYSVGFVTVGALGSTLTSTDTSGNTGVISVVTSPTIVDAPTLSPTQAPTTITKVLVHPDSSIQDAAQGWSHGITKSGLSNGIVWVTDAGAWNANPNDYTWGVPMIELDCFNIQQAIWYGLKSTINADGSTTIIKSPFSEVGITFLKNGAPMASCRLTYQTVDKIDKAGLWNDGDSVGAWAMYDSASVQ